MLRFDLYRLVKELLVKRVVLIVVLTIGHRESIIPSTVMQLVEFPWQSILIS